MENNLMVFDNEEFGKVKVIGDKDNPLFHLDDIGFALGYTKQAKGKLYLRKDRINKILKNAEISTVVHNGQHFINEDGVYEMILESRTEKSRRFRKWVTSEVLPQIRQTGGYIPVQEDMDDSEIMARALMIADNTIKKKDQIIKQLTPKAEHYDVFLSSNGNIDFQEFTKTAKLNIGRNKFMERLRNEEILMSNKSRKNIPFQRYINSGYFEVIQVVQNNFSTHKTLITKKGCQWLYKKSIEWGLTSLQ